MSAAGAGQTLILWGESKLQESLLTIDTVDGIPLLTVADTPIETVDEASFLYPRYWQTADVSSDAGIPFSFVDESNPFQPFDQGDEAVFSRALLSMSWSMAATIRVSARINGARAPLTRSDGGIIEFVDTTFGLEQQGTGLERISRVIPIPLVQRLVLAGAEKTRWYLSGQRLQIKVESTGPLGVGELMIDGCQIECDHLRKRDFPGGVQT